MHMPNTCVWLRGVPPSAAMPQYVQQALAQFGTVIDVALGPAQGQATARFAAPEMAALAARQGLVQIHGHNVVVTQADAGDMQQQQMMAPMGGAMPMAGAAPRALDVTIRQAAIEVSRDVLSQVFSRAGAIDSISVTPCPLGASPTAVQTATVVFVDAAAARTALETLQGRSIYPNADFLELRFAAAAPAAAPYGMQGYGMAGGLMPQQQQPQPDMYGRMPPPQAVPGAAPYGYPMPGPQGGAPYGAVPQPPAPYGAYPGAPPGAMPGGRGGAYGNAPYGSRGRGFGYGRGAGAPPPQGGMPYPPGPYPPAPYPQVDAYGRPVAPYGAESAVILVSGVGQTVALMKLFTLLEVYGNVLGLRRMTKTPETVLAKFERAEDAQVALSLLQGAPFFGHDLALKRFDGYSDRGSGFTTTPAGGSADDPATTCFDFTGTRHRGKPFMPAGQSSAFGRKFRPGKNLFVANLTEAITDAELNALFQEKGFVVSDYLRKTPMYSILAFESTADAIAALVAVHGTQLKERYLRVTFSNMDPAAAAALPAAGGAAAADGEAPPAPKDGDSA